MKKIWRQIAEIAARLLVKKYLPKGEGVLGKAIDKIDGEKQDGSK